MLTLIRKYDAEIHYTDTQIQRFYEYYQTKELNTESLWVITADHGEGLGTHNWWLHGKHIYNEQLRVPLLFYFSSGFGNGRVIEEVVENVDIFPTVIKLAGGSPPSSGEIQGEALLPFFFPKEGRSYHKPNAFSQRKAFEGVTPTRIDPKKTNYEGGEKYSLQSARHKYIYRTSGEEEFFDLQADPYETVNLANTASEEKQQLRKELLKKIEQLKPKTPVEKQTVDKEAIEQLKSLGYVQ